jgi:hypothetical protein
MGRLKRVLVVKFQDWAIGRLGEIFAQYIGFSILAFTNHQGVFDSIFLAWRMPIVSQVLDGLWWLDTIYTFASTLYNVFGKASRGGPNY